MQIKSIFEGGVQMNSPHYLLSWPYLYHKYWTVFISLCCD